MSIKKLRSATIPIHRSRTLTTTLTLHASAVALWDLSGPQGTLRCRAIPSTYGYAFVLLLANDILVWELLRSAEALVDKASRVEVALRARGWRRVVSARHVH